MRPASFKSDGASISIFSCLLSLLFFLSGCAPEKPISKVDENQAYIDSFVKGPADPAATFPEAEFAQAKVLKQQRKLNTAEKLLLDKLESARLAARGTTQLGQYLVRLNNILFDEGKDTQALEYGEIAARIFYDQPIEKRPAPPWFVNLHSYLGMSYERQGRYPDAEKQFQKAITMASSAPRAEVSDAWMNLLYQHLASVYKAQKKEQQAQQVLNSLKKLKRG